MDHLKIPTNFIELLVKQLNSRHITGIYKLKSENLPDSRVFALTTLLLGPGPYRVYASISNSYTTKLSSPEILME